MTMPNTRILVIDDDLEIWKAYQAVLSPKQNDPGPSDEMASLLSAAADPLLEAMSKFHLRFAVRGQEGFALVQDSLTKNMPFAATFIDIRMPPGWDGMETAARIRQIDPHIEIVIVTAYSDRSREEIVRAVGMPDKLLFLRKPFDPEELAQMALSLTEKWNLGRQKEVQRRELQAILMTTPAAIFTVDANRLITSWNRAAERITGYPASEVVGKPCIFTGVAENNECVDCYKGSEWPSEASREIEIRDKTGSKRTISKSSSFIRDRTGHVLGMVESFWDITAMKESEAALRNSETRFRTLVETTSDWVWEVDAEGRFTYCSPICETIYGYRPEELQGRSICDTLLPAGEVAGFRSIFYGSVRDVVSFRGIERRSLRKDGKIIYVESSGTPIIGDDGKVIGFRGIDRDITERKRNEEQRLELEEKYRQSQKVEALGTLAGGIAHDLNNVLTPIMGHADLCLRGIAGDNPIHHNLREIVRSAEKAADLLHQILAFSRKQILVLKPLDLNVLIKDFAKLLRRLIREDVEVQLDLEEDLGTINADQSQMQQILINLLVNARDAISQSGNILIRTRNEVVAGKKLFDIDHQALSGYFVVLSVSDNGVGIDEATLARIFDPFFTTKEAGKGTGLGLSTVYGIVNQHEGHILVDTQPGRGTTFSIYFNRTEEEVCNEDATKSPQVGGGSETILLAEDNVDVRITITLVLESFGYHVITASSGTEAISIFTSFEGKIDLLLTDIVMPEAGGKTLADVLRSKQPDLPIIFMSGYPFELVPNELVEIDNSFFIQKPFNSQDIARKIREAIDRRAGESTQE